MGNLCLTPEQRRDRELAKEAKKHHNQDQEKVKLLLLGTGESGKSAIFKQIKMAYGGEYTEMELGMFRQVIHSNVIEAMTGLCEAVVTLGIEDKVEAKEDFAAVRDFESSGSLSVSLPHGKTAAQAIKTLWADPAIQEAWSKRSQFQVMESHKQFLDDVERVSQPGFHPTHEDIVLARVRTTGINAEHFVIEGKTFTLLDVGGQKNERRKWIHAFDNVNAVMFVVAISDYDMMCFEDNTTNRIVEALSTFAWITGHEQFKEIPVLLFLNKRDLLQAKLAGSPIASVEHFSDYQGGADYDQACAYFQAKFEDEARAHNAQRPMYTHITCATDKDNIQHVFKACREFVLEQNLVDAGMM